MLNMALQLRGWQSPFGLSGLVILHMIGCSNALPPAVIGADADSTSNLDGENIDVIGDETRSSQDVVDIGKADGVVSDANACVTNSHLSLGVHPVAGFSDQGGACALYSMQRVQGYQIQHVGCSELKPESPYNQWEEVRWRAPDCSETIASPLGSALDVRQAGILPVAGTDAIWCDWPGCRRIDNKGKTLWTSDTGGSRCARIDGALVRGGSVFVPTFVNPILPKYSQKLAVSELDLATGATVTVWPDSIAEAKLEQITLRSIRGGLGNSLLVAGTVFDEVITTDAVGDAGWPFVAKLNSNGTYAWTMPTAKIERRATRAEVAVLAGGKSVLALISVRDKVETSARRMLVVRLAETDGTLQSQIDLPGLHPDDGDGCLGSSQTYMSLAPAYGDRFVVLGLAFSGAPLPQPNRWNYPYKCPIYVFDGFLNLRQAFKLPLDVKETDGGIGVGRRAAPRSPQLMASDAFGFSIHVDNKEVRVSPWGQASSSNAGLCATLSLDDCADTNPCTNDLCDPKLGCTHANLPDGAACSTKGTCKAGACLEP